MSPQMQAIWNKIRTNHIALDNCPLHDFQPVPREDPRVKSLHDYACVKCGGRIDAIAHSHYARGRADGLSASKVMTPDDIDVAIAADVETREKINNKP